MSDDDSGSDFDVSDIKRVMHEARLRKKIIKEKLLEKQENSDYTNIELIKKNKKLTDENEKLHKKIKELNYINIKLNDKNEELIKKNTSLNDNINIHINNSIKIKNSLNNINKLLLVLASSYSSSSSSSISSSNTTSSSSSSSNFTSKNLNDNNFGLNIATSSSSNNNLPIFYDNNFYLNNKKILNENSKSKGYIVKRLIEVVNSLKSLLFFDSDYLNNENKIELETLQSLSDTASSTGLSVDSAILDMCKNLEDENEHLTLEIQKLKNTIQTIEQESMQAKLIPHYRLAILRARTHAANLMEQINKEKETSSHLRLQLEETYEDLKKVVEEKRILYKKLNKKQLKYDEKNNFLYNNNNNNIKQNDNNIENYNLNQNLYDELKKKHFISTTSSSSSNNNNINNNFSGVTTTSTSIPFISSLYHDDDNLTKKQLEQGLKQEIYNIDNEIENLRDQISQVAMSQSQKFIDELVDSVKPTN